MIEKSLIQYNEDDRAQRLLNIFDILDGQVNASFVCSAGHIVAWHKHEIQTDYWTCLKGAFKVGLAIPVKNDKGDIDSFEVRWEYLSDRHPGLIKIEPGVYHGYKALKPDSILLYYVTEKYNPLDEFRVKPGYFGENWDVENK